MYAWHQIVENIWQDWISREINEWYDYNFEQFQRKEVYLLIGIKDMVLYIVWPYITLQFIYFLAAELQHSGYK